MERLRADIEAEIMGNELAVAAPSVSQTRGSWWKLQGVFFEPRTAFEEIERKPNWLLPLFLLTLMSVAAWFVSVQRIGLDTMARAQLQGSAQWERMSPEAREQAIAMSVSPVMQAIGYVPVVIGPAILLLAISAAFLLAFYLTGTESAFRKLFSASAHAMFGYGLISTVLTIAVLLMAANPKELDVNNLVHTNAAFLANAKEAPVLASLLGSLDLLSFYAIYLLSLGSSFVNKRSLGFNLTVTIVLWAIYVAGKVGLKAVFS